MSKDASWRFHNKKWCVLWSQDGSETWIRGYRGKACIYVSVDISSWTSSTWILHVRKDPKTKTNSTLHLQKGDLKGGLQGGLQALLKGAWRGLEGGLKGAWRGAWRGLHLCEALTGQDYILATSWVLWLEEHARWLLNLFHLLPLQSLITFRNSRHVDANQSLCESSSEATSADIASRGNRGAPFGEGTLSPLRRYLKPLPKGGRGGEGGGRGGTRE